MLCARRFLSLLACAALATGRFLLLQSCALLPSPRRPTAAAATSVLEGSLDDQAISILAQAKPRSLTKQRALEILDNKKEDHEDSTTRTEHQDRILFVAWSGTLICEMYKDCSEARIHLFSHSINIDDAWAQVKQYMKERLRCLQWKLIFTILFVL